MPVTRKRKAVSPDTAKQSTIASQKTINTYGRVTKSQKADQSAKKRKILDTVTIDTLSSSLPNGTPEERSTRQKEQDGELKTTQSKKRSRETEEEEVTTPQNKRFRNALPPTPAETPSKSASKLFERLILDHAAPASTNSAQETVYDTPPLTPRAFKTLGSSLPTTELPSQLQDLTRLFTAFLTSTSLYCAHNGLGTPMYITNLLPHVTRSWRTRAVTEADMYTILGILGENNTFELADNGEGSLCIELLETNYSTTGHFNQPELIEQFHNRLSALWNQWTSSSPSARSNIQAFLSQLPTVNIITSQVAPSNPTHLTKGSQRLQDIKATALAARAAQASARKPLVAPSAKSDAAVASRGANLLDRILAKQAANANKAAAPDSAHLARLSAIDRISDIVEVLDVLSNGRARASFSTRVLLSHLQNSLRNPISAEEGEKCLSIMAREVARNFVKIIRAGSVDAVVITRGGKPRPDELRAALEVARNA
ncbi:unnamed protein product [Aureobasidium uvarum]|uniref:DNA replication factor Cdt1 C-terminal domain-containing protein n=1 Tax=Aureobasidium uvarum TaxID=2773716 RepID=A0A9N8KHZ0_9PEZI|nr:unnamed protein product [Aureobasidium uvarum]